LKERAERSPFNFSSPLKGKNFLLFSGAEKRKEKEMNIRIRVLVSGIALATLVATSANNDAQAQDRHRCSFLPIVLNNAPSDQPITPPLPEPSPTPLPEIPEKKEFDLSLDLRGEEGVTVINDRPDDWDGKANSIVSLIVVDGTAEFLFQRWGPPGRWDTVEAEKTVTLEGTVNLAEYEQGVWNDTLQKVTIADDSVVVLYEENDGSGITIVLTASPPEPSPTPLPEIPEKKEFDLSLDLREEEGVTILNDRPDWDGKANSIVSFITVDGTAEFLFQRWGPPGKWDTLQEEKTVTLEGTVNLAEYEQGVWNDTLQKVTVGDDSVVVLYEENDGSGITIVLVG